MGAPLTATHRVRTYELDSFGHVNNAVFLNYLEHARTEYLLQRGLSFDIFEKWNAFPYVVEVYIKYKVPAIVHDILEIRGEITSWKRVSFVLHYEIFNQTKNRLCAVADVTFGFVDGNEKLIHIPEEFREKMA